MLHILRRNVHRHSVGPTPPRPRFAQPFINVVHNQQELHLQLVSGGVGRMFSYKLVKKTTKRCLPINHSIKVASSHLFRHDNSRSVSKLNQMITLSPNSCNLSQTFPDLKKSGNHIDSQIQCKKPNHIIRNTNKKINF